MLYGLRGRWLVAGADCDELAEGGTVTSLALDVDTVCEMLL